MKSLSKSFIFLVPVILLLGVGVFTKTIKKSASANSCYSGDLSGIFDTSAKLAYFEGENIAVPAIASSQSEFKVLGTSDSSEKWVEIDLSEQKLKAWDGENLFLETPISSGLPWTPTPKGEFRIWIKLRYTRMEGGEGKYYYNLPNVPYTMFFYNAQIPKYRGYGLHGTYWHNDFGKPHSHGCVNLPTNIAEKIFYWSTPVLPQDKSVVYASDNDPGTRIVIHD